MRFVALGIFLLTLSACSSEGDPKHYLQMKNITAPSPEKFDHCYSYGCEKVSSLALPSKTKQSLIKLFKANDTAKQERQNIAQAIAIFEQDIGAIVGTKADKYGTFRIFEGENDKYDMRFQQDCVDESTNTTTYLMLLKHMRLTRFHEPGFPRTRQPFFNGNRWWHQTATMQEIESGEHYAVDSWFHDNGKAAEIVPLKKWKAGWSPHK